MVSKLGKRAKKKYNKKVDECMNKHYRLLHHHYSSVFQRFANELFKLNAEFFDMKQEEIKE